MGATTSFHLRASCYTNVSERALARDRPELVSTRYMMLKVLLCICLALIGLSSALSLSGTRETNSSALSARQWTWKYTCDSTSAPLAGWDLYWPARFRQAGDSNQEQRSPAENSTRITKECILQREPGAWIYKYVDELEPDSFRVIVGDDSLDQRLANQIYAATTNVALDLNKFHFNSGQSKQDELNLERVAGSQVDDQLCAQQLDSMLWLIENLRFILASKQETIKRASAAPINEAHLRLGRVLDSFGRYEPGFQAGRSMSLGSYSQCETTPLLLGANYTRMRFCWANLSVNMLLDAHLRQRKRLDHENKLSQINVGICLPVACHSKSFKSNAAKLQKLVNSQFKLPESLYLNLNELTLESVFCLPDSDSPHARLSTSATIFLALLLGWLCLVCWATLISNRSSSSTSCNGWLACLSLVGSWHSLHASRPNRRNSSLDALDGLRVLLCGSIVLGHIPLYNQFYAVNKIEALAAAEMDWRISIQQTMIFSVDTFFVMSSLLMSYLTLKRLSSARLASSSIGDKKTCSLYEFARAWLYLTLTRYLRLVPVFFLVNTFVRLIFQHLSSGPLWDYGLNRDTATGSCLEEPWHLALSWLSIYRICSLACLAQAWSVGMEIFYAFLLPPLVLLLHKWPQAMLRTLVALILITLALSYVDFFTQHINEPRLWEIRELRFHGNHYLRTSDSNLYTSPLYRAPVFLSGILAGYFVFKGEIRAQEKQVKNTWKKFRWFITTAAILVLVITTISTATYQRVRLILGPAHRLLFVNFFIGNHVVWAFACASLMVASANKANRHNKLVRFLAQDFWQPLAKITYVVYLVHLPLNRFILEMGEQMLITNFWNNLGIFFTVLCLTLPLSTFVYLVFESPFDRLIRGRLVPALMGHWNKD